MAFWPALTLMMFAIAFFLWGGAHVLPPLVVVIAVMGVLAWMVVLLVRGFKRMRLPKPTQMHRRSVDSVAGAPVSASVDACV
mgnify:CR=1 FL=1